MRILSITSAFVLAGLLAAAEGAHAATYQALTFVAWGLEGDRVWSGARGNTLTTLSDDMYFTKAAGFTALNRYDANFASSQYCGDVQPPGSTLNSTRKYGCRFTMDNGTPVFVPLPPSVPNGGVVQAEAMLDVTEAGITGQAWPTSSSLQPRGFNNPNQVGVGSDFYNYRSEESSLGNAWHGLSSSTTLYFDLSVDFDGGNYDVTGGTVRFTDSRFLCQQGGVSTPANVLCTPSAVAGGFQANGSHMSWGWDADGAGSGSALEGIEVRDATGQQVVAVLQGVHVESRTVYRYGGVLDGIAVWGEFRRAIGDASCGATGHLRWDGTRITCGTLITGRFGACIGFVLESYCDVVRLASGDVPLPAAGWLALAAAASLPAFARRRRA